MDRGFTPKHFVGLFDGAQADRRIDRAFASEFGSLSRGIGRGNSAPAFYKRLVLYVVTIFSAILAAYIEVVIDFEYLKGRQNEIVVKIISVASRNLTDSFRFKSHYNMATHGSDENGLNWDDGHINYHELFTVVSEAVAGFAHLYSYGVTKCKFLAELLGRPVRNLQDFNRPKPATFNHKRWCSLPCHKFHNINCATKTRIPSMIG